MHDRLPHFLELLVRWGVLRVSEAELGDILEDYARGRSRWWLWAQIFSVARRATMLSNLRSDIRYGMRSLCQNPGFTFAAVLTIALGIGINTGIFSIVNNLALRPLRVPDGDKLVAVYQQFRGVQKRSVSGARSLFSTPEYRTYRDRTQSLSGVMGFAISSSAYSRCRKRAPLRAPAKRHCGPAVPERWYGCRIRSNRMKSVSTRSHRNTFR
ncbi:MAG TPA: hypothetical protein VFR18_14325 [Terriglobia bacterium]|nr:hypothetical protein [Terriglobia bacterium]